MSKDRSTLQHNRIKRHHGLDYLRASMVVMVVVAHVAVSYQTYPEAQNLTSFADIGERYRNPDRTEVAQCLHQVPRASVNPMFFLLAGYSWAFLLQRRNRRTIVWDRTTRIFIPMVVGWFIAFPLVRYSFALGRMIMLPGEGEASLATAFAETPFVADRAGMILAAYEERRLQMKGLDDMVELLLRLNERFERLSIIERSRTDERTVVSPG